MRLRKDNDHVAAALFEEIGREGFAEHADL